MLLSAVTLIIATGRTVLLCDDEPMLARIAAALDEARPTVHAYRPCSPRPPLDGKLEPARQALYRMDFETAERQLVTIVEELEQRIVPPREDLLGTARILLVWAALDGGAEGRAREYAERFVHLRPSMNVPTTIYPPHLVAFMREVSGRQRREAMLEVNASESGVAVAVDGLVSCSTPCALHGMSAGAHRLTLLPAGRPPHSGVVEVSGLTTVEVAIDHDLRDALWNALQRGDLAAARSAAPNAEVALAPSRSGGTSAWIMRRDASTIMTIELAAGTEPAVAAHAIRERLQAAVKPGPNVTAASPAPQAAPASPFGVEALVAGVVPLSEPQRDAFTAGIFAAGRLHWAVARPLSLVLQAGYTGLVPGNAPEVGGVAHMAVGVGLALARYLVIAAHAGPALTDGNVRGWLDAGLAMPLPVGAYSVRPTLMYVHIFDGGQGALPGDARLLALGLGVQL